MTRSRKVKDQPPSTCCWWWPIFSSFFTLFGLCLALATTPLDENTLPDPVVATTMLVTVLVEDVFYYLFFGRPLK
jgi:hypothetical protein